MLNLKMNRLERRMLFKKQILPIRVEDLCTLIGGGAQPVNVDHDSMITCISYKNSYRPLGEGFLLIWSSDSFAKKRIREGGTAVLTDHVIEGVPCIVVDDVTSAVFSICAWLYNYIELPSVIVSGSVGKTTTKRMIYEVLKCRMSVFAANENRNMLGELCCYLQSVKMDNQIVVWEVCENLKHIAEYSSCVLKPEIAAITNIGDSHLGSIGGKKAQLKNFRELTAGMNENGVVIINADDKESVQAGFDKTIVSVGVFDTTADCVASNIRYTRKGTAFDLRFRNESEHVEISGFGIHNVYDAMMAYVVGALKDIDRKAILKALKNYRNSGIRQNIIHVGGTTIYADCYNASGKSISYAISAFCDMPEVHGERVAVLGDIAEIDGYEVSTYREIAEAIDNSALDVLLTVGKDSAMIHDYVKRDMVKEHFASLADLNAYLKKMKREGKNSYLFKASRSVALEQSIRAVFPIHYYRVRIMEKLRERFCE